MKKTNVFKDCTPFVRQGPNKCQASKLASELKDPHKHVVMRNAEGAGDHCHMGPMHLLHQTIFDWHSER